MICSTGISSHLWLFPTHLRADLNRWHISWGFVLQEVLGYSLERLERWDRWPPKDFMMLWLFGMDSNHIINETFWVQPQKLRSKDNPLCHFQIKLIPIWGADWTAFQLNNKEDVILQSQCLGTDLPQERGQQDGLFEVTKLLLAKRLSSNTQFR